MYGIKVRYFVADISDSDARGKLIDQTKEAFGRLNVLVNNAGVAPRERRDILEATEDSFERVMRINVQGPYFLTQLAARWMVEQSRADESFSGSIVTVTSISSTVASPSRGEYCMSKAALSMSSQLWAVRLAEFGISVYEVRPGVIRTDMTRAVESIYDEKIAQGLTLQPRWGEPADVGKAVAMLVRGDLPYSTGQVIMVDGGLTVPRL
jgi:NAD(P)-dependent dehydrogenase (short-subunit alcohol dehydrogenase family)